MSKIKIFKKVNAKCMIKGCRSNGRKVDTFYVSASEGYGPSAILCEDCIESLYERLKGIKGDGALPQSANADSSLGEGASSSTAEAVPLPLGKGGEEGEKALPQSPDGDSSLGEGAEGGEEGEAVDKAPETPKKKRSSKSKA